VGGMGGGGGGGGGEGSPPPPHPPLSALPSSARVQPLAHYPRQPARIIMAFEGLQTETVKFRGHNGDMSEAYFARPSSIKRVGGVVVIHGAGGWDEWVCETTRKFAHNGFAAIAPNFFVRFGEGSADDVAARARNAGGGADAEVMGAVVRALAFLRAQSTANGKIAVDRHCPGG